MPTGVHPVFNVELVRPAATDPFPSQFVDNTQPPPLEVDGEVEYEVEKILYHRERRVRRGKQAEVLVKWTRYAETVEEMEDCTTLDKREAIRPNYEAFSTTSYCQKGHSDASATAFRPENKVRRRVLYRAKARSDITRYHVTFLGSKQDE